MQRVSPAKPLPPKLERFFPIITVADFGRSLEFYAGVLGLTPGYRWPPEGEGEPQFVVVSLGESSLGLAQAETELGEDRDRFELCFYTDDVDVVVRQLRVKRVPVLREPEDMPWGERMAFVADPDGNRIHLTA
jgi:lactoylglutathione lyase